MKKFTMGVVAALSAAFAAGSASATVIDFAAEGFGGGERGVADGTILNTAALGGINLQFSGGVGGAGANYAYFNGAAAGHQPGLGICTALNLANRCSPGVDDNITINEFVKVAFVDGPFDVNLISFNIDPASLGAGMVKITTSLGAVLSVFTMSFAQASTFGFGFADWIQFDFVDTEYLVASISDAPIPGALPLLFSGLVGLGFAASRRKRG